MHKRIFYFLIFLTVTAVAVFGGGRQDNESHEVDTPSGFTESIDIENKKSGKYNYFLEAKDKGGNTAIAGPDNIYIDPESDLPIAKITNPRENMHVQGNLNIVGTCVDDDGVRYVELWFNDDPDTTVRAEGAEFWSYYYDTARFPDKLYSISARGVDINGLPGRETRVNWNLDRKKPDTKVESHELGALVAGNITLKGTVWDGNGIDSLSYSLDGGNSYLPLSVKYDKNNDIYKYELKVNTRTFEDGPAVIWFQARDKMGTVGAASHLVFVDNTGPDVQIVYPNPEDAVNGIFTVAGSAQDTVGLSSLTWKLGKETGEFELTVGNPWWVKEFDIRGQKTKSVDLEIRAVDLSGNVTTARRKVVVDQEADLPKITLQEPQAAAVISADGVMTLTGLAADDDGVEAVFYALDGGEAVEIPCSGYFQFNVSGIPDGIHVLDVWSRDITGVEGPKTTVKGIVAPGAAPEPQISGVRFGAGKTAAVEEFYTGKVLNPESGAVLELLVNSGSALTALSWRFGNNEPVSLALKAKSGGEFRQDIVLPADIPFGLVKLEIRAADIHGREGIWDEYLYITDLTTANPDDVAVVRDNSSSGGLRLENLGEQPWKKGVSVPLPRGSKTGIPVSALYTGEQPVKSAVFTVGDRQVRGTAKASPTGGWQITGTIPPDISAGLSSLSLDVVTKIDEALQVSGDFFILRPADGRTINTGRSFQWVRPDGILDGGRILISRSGAALVGLYSGRPLKSAVLSSVEVSAGEVSGEDAAEGAASPGETGNFRVRVDEYGRLLLQAAGEGSFGPVSLTLTDKDGNTYETGPYNFLVDFADPVIRIARGVEGTWVQNKVQVQFSGGDANKIRSADFSINLGTTWQPLLQSDELTDLILDAELERTLDISSLQDGAVNVIFRVVDEAGRRASASFSVLKDTRAPMPQLVVPVSGARVNGTIRLGIAIQEAGRLKSITYNRPAGGTEEEPIPEISKVLYSGAASGGNPVTFLDVLLEAEKIPLSSDMSFIFEDNSGNSSSLNYWPFIIDSVMDVPVIELSLPLDNEVITTDFVISGVMYDDDAVKQVWWRIDDNPERILEGTNGYSIPVALLSLTDNEHTITVFAEDIYGVKSQPVERTIRVSLEEPKAAVELPAFEEIVKGTVRISGVASDMNDISRIQVSVDNGNTYNDASGTTMWAYDFNSKIIQDGTHVVFIRAWDGYNISALYSSLINLDNTPPEVTLEAPLDGAVTTGSVYITGRAIDAIQLEDITIELRSLEGYQVPEEVATRHVKPGSILMEELDLSFLSDGIYNIEVWAIDKAENITRVSRNVQLSMNSQQNFVDTLYPLNGEHVQGSFNLYGYVGGIDKAYQVTLMINGYYAATEPVTETGYFRFSLSGENLREGLNEFVVRSDFGGKELVESEVRSIFYRPVGPWVTIDSINIGDFAYERPWLNGRGGYYLTPEEEEVLADKKADKALKAAIEAKKLDYVDLSFDNGKTFFDASSRRDPDVDWRYRLETGEMIEGLHYIIVRANMVNGETAVTRMLVQVDKTPPTIRLIAPQAGGRYNQSLEYTALASDDVELKSLTYHLRIGDKAAYEVPGFIQGLYFEFLVPPFIKQIWNGAPGMFAGGATYMDFGMGLSFFEDNVKVQFQYGWITQDLYESMGQVDPLRYGGQVLGVKLLANIYALPFGSFMGPDWEWLSASFALGANFSLFDIGQKGYTQSGKATWLSAMLVQIEFPKVTIPKRKNLRTFSLFTEGQLWFVPTDVNVGATAQVIKTLIPHIVVGLRMYIF
jgi:hypothetical protein